MKETYGDRFRVTLEKNEGIGDGDRVHRYEIHGKYGFIYPYSDQKLAAWVRGSQISSRALKLGKPYVRAEGEAIVLFAPTNIDQFAALIQARKRKQLGPEVLLKLKENLGKARK